MSALPKYRSNVEIYFAGTRKQFTNALNYDNPDKLIPRVEIVNCSDGVWKNTKKI